MTEITFRQLASMYIADHYLRPATAINYERIADIADRDTGDIPITQITSQHLISWRQRVIGRASETTWNTYARHTTTTLLTDARRPNAGSLRVAQEILGHSSITTTAVYMHPDLEQMRAALEGLPKIKV